MNRNRRLLLAGGVAAGFLAGLATCERSLGQDRIVVCRQALPALARGPEVRFQSAGSGALGSVRVDYTEGTRPHRLTCRFDGASNLVEIAVDGTALSGSALHMLRRYYLDTPDAARADPGRS
jgi:hypothetical protein